MAKTTIKTRPIPFSEPMVRAILDGRKTQTRRTLKRQTPDGGTLQGPVELKPGSWGWHYHDTEREEPSKYFPGGVIENARLKCPYGAVGERLWAREAYYQIGHWEPVTGVKTKTGKMKWKFVADSDEIRFEAPAEFRKGRHNKDPETSIWHKRLARFMPRWASRLTLEITDIRVERLQGISREDAIAEGIEHCTTEEGHRFAFKDYIDEGYYYSDPIPSFRSLWKSINGPDSWDLNPWVWVLAFEVVSDAS